MSQPQAVRGGARGDVRSLPASISRFEQNPALRQHTVPSLLVVAMEYLYYEYDAHRDGAHMRGGAHVAAITSEGHLYTWGWNAHGQCGQGDVGETVPLPRMLGRLFGKPVGAVACGAHHTVVVCAGGAVHACGKGEYGRLGSIEHSMTPLALMDAAKPW